MKKYISLLLAAVMLTMGINMFSVSAAEKNDKQLRGVWLSTVNNLDFPSKTGLGEKQLKSELDSVIETCVNTSINAVFFQARPCADALYKSDFFPWSAVITGTQGKAPENGFDPLAYLVEKAHARGIEVHAWVNPYRIGKDSKDVQNVLNGLAENSPAKLHPEYRVICSDGGVYFNPALPEVRQLIISGVEELVRGYDIDGIHFDDYFYPYGVTDYPDAADFEKYGAAFSDIADFRRDNVNKLVSETYAAVHRIKSSVKFGISPFGIWDNQKDNPDGSKTSGMSSYRAIYADSKKWVESGWVDYICPQLYWAFETEAAPFGTLVDWWSALCAKNNVELYVGHALYKLGTDNIGFENASQLERQLDKCKQSGVSGNVYFRYGNIKNDTAGCCDVIRSAAAEPNQSTAGISSAEVNRKNTELPKAQPTLPKTGGKLVITSPSNGYVTESEYVSVSGVADVNQPLFLDGNAVQMTEHGYFASYLKLEYGKNTFTYTNGNSSASITVNRALPSQPKSETVSKYFKKDSAGIYGDIILYSGECVQFSIYAVEGSTVCLSVFDEIVKLEPTDQRSGEYVMYSGMYTAPALISGSLSGSYGYYAIADGTPDMSNGIGAGITVISTPLEKYTQSECYVYNDTGDGSMMDNYQLPSATQVYATALMNGMYRLQSGKWIIAENVADISPEIPDIDIDTEKYIRADIVYEHTPTYQPHVSDDGVLALDMYGATGKIQVQTENENIQVQTENKCGKTTVSFTLNNNPVEGYYIRRTDDNTLSVWIYNNRKGTIAGKVIAIDPGHGGEDSGAQGAPGADGPCENELNLSVSLLLAERLKSEGAIVYLTRQDDSTVYLAQRAGMIRSYKPDISISIHHNSVPQSADFNKASGTLVLYSRQTALPLADIIAKTADSRLDVPNNGTKAQSLNVCRDYRYPCILIECGFVCNPAEYEKLLTDSYKTQLCENITQSIIDYFN